MNQGELIKEIQRQFTNYCKKTSETPTRLYLSWPYRGLLHEVTDITQVLSSTKGKPDHFMGLDVYYVKAPNHIHVC